MNKRKVIIDCDPGMDDSMAIVLGCKSDTLSIEAITTVNGNYPVEVTTKNALKVLEMLDRPDIPVAKGLGKPILRESPKDPFSHGKDGQAENNLPEPTLRLNDLHAVDLMIDTIRKNPGEITLICLGPLSNLALAMIKEPAIIEEIHQVIAISGAFGLNEYAFRKATGDTPQSEWNVYVDPEAADIVYKSGVDFTAIGLDIATHFDVNMTTEQIELLEKSPNPEAKFLLNAIQFVNKRGYEAYTTIIDCLAVAYAIDPELIETFEGKVGIELKGTYAFANTVLDRRDHHSWESMTKINIGSHVNYNHFLEMIIQHVIA